MEYVVVTCFIMLPLIGFSSLVAAPGGRAMFSVLPSGESAESFGVLGQAFVDACRLLLSGISLPIP